MGFLYNFLLGEGMYSVDSITVVLQQFILVLLCCLLLFQMAMREEYFQFSKEPMFWISGGLLVFSMGTLVALGMSQFIRMNHITIQNINLYRIIMPVLNVILYSSYIIGFILCKRKKKSYLQSS